MVTTVDRLTTAFADRYRIERELGRGMPEFDRIVATAARRGSEINA
jgi:hypothetical protein